MSLIQIINFIPMCVEKRHLSIDNYGPRLSKHLGGNHQHNTQIFIVLKIYNPREK